MFSFLVVLIFSAVANAAYQQQVCVVDSDCPSSTTPMYCQKTLCAPKGICATIPDLCPTDYNPVCSCDKNFTSGNACLAAQARTNFYSFGKCPSEAGCLTNADCAPNNFCEKVSGSCDDTGFCIPLPTSCPGESSPVCGCDGNSYKSECFASLAGASVDYPSTCIPRVTCSSITDCQSGQFCKLPIATCPELSENQNFQVTGTCEPVPVNCSTQYDPVCGCNGKTYTNGCFADLDRMPIASVDECDSTKKCTSASDCASTELCQKDVGLCKNTGAMGLCIEKPHGCFTLYDPVCGCDNVTYSNDCRAFTKGMNIAYEGICTN